MLRARLHPSHVSLEGKDTILADSTLKVLVRRIVAMRTEKMFLAPSIVTVEVIPDANARLL